MTSTTLRMLVTDRVNQIVFVSVALVIAVAYTVMLPFAYTERITLRNWQYLDARYLAFSIGFSLATGWLLMSHTYAIRRVVPSRGGMVGGAGVLAGLIPSLVVLLTDRSDTARLYRTVRQQPQSGERSYPVHLCDPPEPDPRRQSRPDGRRLRLIDAAHPARRMRHRRGMPGP